jgi:uncharacterized protein DUF2795
MIASTTESKLRRCLDGVQFPASRDDLIAAAIYQHCDQETVEALRAAAPVTYASARQVIAQITIVDTPVRDTSNAKIQPRKPFKRWRKWPPPGSECG